MIPLSNAKLSSAERARAVEMYRTHTAREVGEEFGVEPSTIGKMAMRVGVTKVDGEASRVAQQQNALALANAARQAAATAKSELAEGSLTLDEALTDERLSRVKLFSVLTSLPGMGLYRSRRLLRQADVDIGALARNVEELTIRQIMDLAATWHGRVAQRRRAASWNGR